MDVFSFCIYGPHEFYYRGLRENIELIQTYYPNSHVFTYIGNDAREDLLQSMRSYPNTHWIPTGCSGATNMVWRFFAIDDPRVTSMHVRDADSRCHIRDRWCIDQFMKSDYITYTIRDNPGHQIRMMGGLWGSRKLPFSIRKLYLASRKELLSKEPEFGYDQTFLAKYLWPLLKDSFASYGYAQVEPEEHYTPIDPSLPERPFCGMVE
jgi:hypothetical protein